MISVRTIGIAAFGLTLGLVGPISGSQAEPVRTTPPTTVAPPTTTPTTAPPATRPAGGDQTAATMEGSCALAGGAVTCTWGAPANPAAVRILMLRGSANVGRVFGPYSPTAGTATDTTVKSGVTYSYVMVALDSNNKSIAHTPGTFITVP